MIPSWRVRFSSLDVARTVPGTPWGSSPKKIFPAGGRAGREVNLLTPYVDLPQGSGAA